ncbi:hypothetical protein ACO0QE_000437 [Hanseniaspora vineae]
MSGVVATERINRAYDALSKYLKTKQEDQEENGSKKMLIADDDEELMSKLQLIFVNNKSFTGSNNKLQFKPLVLPLAHSLYAKMQDNADDLPQGFKILLILNDKHGINIDADDESSVIYKLKQQDNISVDKIIVGKDLKTTYKAFEKRRQFLNDFSLILCDDSIVTTMPKLMGGKFYNKLATTPIPIRVSQSATTLYNSVKKLYNDKLVCKIPRGTTLNVSLGDFQWFTKEETVANIQSVADSIISKYNIRSVFVKTNFSPALPLYFNQESIDVLFKELEHSRKTADEDEEDEEDEEGAAGSVEIDGVEIGLNVFNKALMEIANPDELDVLFKKQITQSKKRRAGEEEKEVEETPKETKATKKAKK